MPNPNIPQGTLNRVRASVIWPSFPQLTVTSSFLGKRGIALSFAGDTTVYIDTMTGAVTSPEPYLRITLTIHLLKTQYLANLYRAQQEDLSLLGDCTVRPDAAALQPYAFSNCAIMRPGDLDFSGADPDYPVQIGGIYQVNGSLFT
jgi:hypothetical protein